MPRIKLTRIVTNFVAASAVLVTLSPEVRAENMTDALTGAYKTSGLLQQNRALLRAADEDVAIAVSSLRPILDWTTRITRSVNENGLGGFVTDRNQTQGFVGLTAQWLIYDNGGRIAAKKAAQEAVLGTRQGLLNVEQSILLRAVAAYMNVLRATENVSLRENNLRVLGEELRAAQDRFDVGEVTRTDVALAESRQAAARSGLALARGELVNAKEEYLVAVGTKPGRLDTRPTLPKKPASVDTAKNLALRNHPTILQARHQVSASEFLIEQARASLGPTATVQGDIGINNNLRNDNYTDSSSLSLILNQRIYQGGNRSATLRKQMASRDAARGGLLTAQEDIVQEVATAYVGFEVATSSLRATEARIRAARVAFEGVREEATLGSRTTLDVLDAEQELLDALAAQISAQADRYIAAYRLLAAQGLLTAERLGLQVPIYDPAAYYNQVKNAPSAISKRGRDLDRVLQSIGKN